MKMCVLVATTGQATVETLKQLHALYRDGLQVFLYNDGVLLLNEPSFAELSTSVKTTLCAVSADERHVTRSGRAGAVAFGSLYDLSGMIARSDRLISLTVS